jgi:tetratricopeptide (TPR) repeat protein
LTRLVKKNKAWQELLRRLHDSGDRVCLHLLHTDNTILNLPWSIAIDDISGGPIGQIKRLVLARGVAGRYRDSAEETQKAAPPLKILIMTAAPENPGDPRHQDWQRRLSYEDEERAILEAFEPLMSQGLVEVDFTASGSLQALEEKIKANKYHILHFTGHADFDEETGTGVLELEKEMSMAAEAVTDREFAEAVICKAGHRSPLVMLSSCRTAQGKSEKGLGGVTNQLLRAGVPVVAAMGMLILDYYAAYFSAAFYGRMAKKETVFEAFRGAVLDLKEKEALDHARGLTPGRAPLQWLIPKLYMGQPLEGIVDWDAKVEKLELSPGRYLFHRERLVLEHEQNYLFIGRRREKSEILEPFMVKTPILIKGQGGVGKTAMAEHLVQRLIAKDGKTVPLVFDETSGSIDNILEKLRRALKDAGNWEAVFNLEKIDKAAEQVEYLLSELARLRTPVLVFDNLESFQEEKGGAFSGEYADMAEVIAALCRQRKYHMILTCRYPVKGFEGLYVLDLNQVGLTDFWKRSIYMDVGHIRDYLQESAGFAFIDVVKLLHRTFGGNYRALEFFNELVRREPGKLKESLVSLEAFEERTAQEMELVKQEMGKDLLFSQLTALLEPDHTAMLALLSNFRMPVTLFAMRLQLTHPDNKEWAGVDVSALLNHLHGLTLIEISMDRETGHVYFYVTPIVKDLLPARPPPTTLFHSPSTMAFAHQLAGNYYYHIVHNMDGGLNEYEEGFYHFEEAGDLEKMEETGNRLSSWYYDYSLYHNAFYYARRVVNRLGDQADPVILNLLGLIYDLYGDYDRALELYQKASTAYVEIGDKAGEGTTLNNISQIYHSLGDYDRALKFLEKSLNIRRDIGDKRGVCNALHNMAGIAHQKKDIQQFLDYETRGLPHRHGNQ